MGVYKARRDKVLAAIDGVMLLQSTPIAIRNNDVEHDHRQDSDLFYLTGFDEQESLLLLTTRHGTHRTVLFVRPRDPEREVWDGLRAGVDGATGTFGADAAFPLEELDQRLVEYFGDAPNLYYGLGEDRAMDDRVLAAIRGAKGRGRATKPWPTSIHDPATVLHEMRLLKTDEEVSLMRRAAEITRDAHLAAMRLAAPGKYEYEVEAVIVETFRRQGSERPAYSPIVGSGPNATILHHRKNDRLMKDGDLLLVDAGCEYGYYASDVTRTYPVNGTFSPAQRKIYELVLQAQLASIAAVKPGSNIEAVHAESVRVLTSGLIDLGFIEGPLDEALEKQSYRKYYMHRTSHWIGMDVHDVGPYFKGGDPRPFAAGMALTVEPGLYISESDETVPEEFRGIGIRIEDDILVTDAGHRDLTSDIPKEPDAVEAACRG